MPANSASSNRPRFRTANGPESSAPSSSPMEAPRCIHIIDDDATLAAALSAGLELHGYHVSFFTTVDDGRTAAHHQHPDLILCDINLPGKNGRYLLDEIRADPALDDCQFVFMTGNPAYADSRLNMDLGADDFLLKPFTLEELARCVDARLKRRAIHRQNETALLAQLRENLHHALPHEFFTPLTGIIGFAELLEQDMDDIPREAVQEALQNIALSGHRLQRTLRNYLSTLGAVAADEDVMPPLLSPADVACSLGEGARAAARRHKREADLQLKLATTPLRGNPQDVALLAEELAENAFSYSARGTPVQIEANATGTSLQVVVRDFGRGMTPQQLRSLGAFRQFERKKYEQQGLGLGLFLVRQCLQRLHGNLHLESPPGGGTTCRVLLPAAPGI